MSRNIKIIIVLFITSFFWSSAGLSGKILLRTFDPLVLTVYRFSLASFILLPFFAAEKSSHKKLFRKLGPISLLSAINVIFFYYGLRITTASASTLIYAATPLAVTILSYLFLKEKVSERKLIGILTGFGGIVMIVLLPFMESQIGFMSSLKGNILIAMAMLTWSLYTIGSRLYLKKGEYSPLSISFISTTVMGGTALLFCLVTKKALWRPEYFSPSNLFWIIYSAIFITIITFLLYQWLIKITSATTASLKHYLEAALAVILNVIFLKEKITIWFLVGSALVFTGIYFATSKKG